MLFWVVLVQTNIESMNVPPLVALPNPLQLAQVLWVDGSDSEINVPEFVIREAAIDLSFPKIRWGRISVPDVLEDLVSDRCLDELAVADGQAADGEAG